MHNRYDTELSNLPLPSSYREIFEVANSFMYENVSGNVIPIYIALVVCIAALSIAIILSLYEEQYSDNHPVHNNLLYHSYAFITTPMIWWTIIVSMALHVIYYIGMKTDAVALHYYIPLALSVHTMIFGYIAMTIIAMFSLRPVRSIIMYTFAFLAQTLSATMISAYYMSMETTYPKEKTLYGLTEMIAQDVIIGTLIAISIGLALRLLGVYLTRDRQHSI